MGRGQGSPVSATGPGNQADAYIAFNSVVLPGMQQILSKLQPSDPLYADFTNFLNKHARRAAKQGGSGAPIGAMQTFLGDITRQLPRMIPALFGGGGGQGPPTPVPPTGA